MLPFVLPLSDPQARLEMVGGKGMSLAKLVRAGLPVPEGFHVTTAAYRQFVAVNELQPRILQALKEVEAAQPATFEAASQAISGLSAAALIPEEIGKAIRTSYENLHTRRMDGGPLPASVAVAVRSSAT